MSDMCTDNRFELIEKYKKKLVEATNIETSLDEMQVLDDILFRFWQMGWLDSIDRMPFVKESARTLMHSGGDSIYAKALRNAGRFIQNAIDGEAPEFEKIPSVEPEPHWIPVDLRNNSPEENKVVLLGVRFRDDFKYFVTSRKDYNYWTGLGREIKGELRWQPLPSPYPSESEE